VAVKSFDAEAFGEGATIATSPGSPDTLGVVTQPATSGNITAAAASAYRGGRGIAVPTISTASDIWAMRLDDAVSTHTAYAARCYWRHTGNPSATYQGPLQILTSTSSNVCRAQFRSNGALELVLGASTSTATSVLTAGVWYRMELTCSGLNGASSAATLNVYEGDSLTVVGGFGVSLSGVTTSVTAGRARIVKNSSATVNAQDFDDFAANSGSSVELGPANPAITLLLVQRPTATDQERLTGRRARVAQPVGQDAALPADAPRRRAAIPAPRRSRVIVLTPPPASPPVPARSRAGRAPVVRRRQSIDQPPFTVAAAPSAPTYPPRKVGRFRVVLGPRRGHAPTPVPAQVVATPPAYPPRKVGRFKLALPPRRRRPVGPVPAQVVIAPTYPPRPVAGRRRAPLLARTRPRGAVARLPLDGLGDVVPIRRRPVALPARPRSRGWVAPPAAASAPPATAARALHHLLMPWRRRPRMVTPVPPSASVQVNDGTITAADRPTSRLSGSTRPLARLAGLARAIAGVRGGERQ
jgi:hypothetical protein